MGIESSVRSTLNQIFSALNQCRFRMESISEFEHECIEQKEEEEEEEEEEQEEEEKDVPTQFLQTQRNPPIHLKDHLKRCSNVLSVFSFNSTKYDIN